jgi:hypothetical protein
MEKRLHRGASNGMRWVSVLILAVFLVPIISYGAPDEATGAVSVELALSGPTAMPLFRKGHGVTFHAVLINRSKSPIVFVPPHKDWSDDQQLEWQAVDAKGHVVYRLPEYGLWCDVHGVMHMGPVSEVLPTASAAAPRTIKDGDVVVLQPGEQYEIAGLADPSFALRFPRRGVYQISLAYTFDPSRYKLPRTSKNAASLKTTGYLSLTSNTLPLLIN